LVASKSDSATKQLKSCKLNDIGNKEILQKKNLVLIDIKCTNVTSKSSECDSSKSFLVYQCKKGFKFNNNECNLKLNKQKKI
jgi:hypothetical protein